jgi:hypothetical protein
VASGWAAGEVAALENHEERACKFKDLKWSDGSWCQVLGSSWSNHFPRVNLQLCLKPMLNEAVPRASKRLHLWGVPS